VGGVGGRRRRRRRRRKSYTIFNNFIFLLNIPHVGAKSLMNVTSIKSLV